jgi:bifunctional N-acetylglucosamine-1-phosphate-uridyltransferase/glucosamine-1-phosphate-acetyltransferase GlmU-like protein
MNATPTAHPLHVVILAAGEGKRMKSALPKVLQAIAGRPMLAHVVDAARALRPAAVHVVYGHGGDAVRAAFADQAGLEWAEQDRQLGTGHAVRQAMPKVPDGAQVLVLYGDVPLITAETLQRLLAAPGASRCWSPTSTTRPVTAGSNAMPKAGSRESSRRRTPTTRRSASAPSTPASSPPNPLR